MNAKDNWMVLLCQAIILLSFFVVLNIENGLLRFLWSIVLIIASLITAGTAKNRLQEEWEEEQKND